MKDFNEIYDDRVVKTTLNIRRDIMARVKGRMKSLDIGCFAWYIRALIQKDLHSVEDVPKKTVSLSEFLGIERPSELAKLEKSLKRARENPLAHPDGPRDYPITKPKLYPGLVAGLKKSFRFIVKHRREREDYQWKINK